MPFTLSHPAAVLPLRRTGLPMAALVCGSMAPDLHMLVPGVTDEMTHRWEGAPTIDLVLGYALMAFWAVVLDPTMRAAAPDALRARLRAAPSPGPRTWLLAVPGVVVGVATHIGWDTFTHQDMWGGQHVPWLYEVHHGHPGFELAQYASSVAGLVIIAAWAAWTLRRRRPEPVAAHPRAVSARAALYVPLVVGTCLGLLALAVVYGHGHRSIDFLAYVLLRTTLAAGSVLAFIGAFLWRTMHGSSPHGRATGG